MNNAPNCKKCHIPMKEGIALKNGYSGIPDFAGDTHVCTLSIDTTKADVVSVWKCPKCGHSIK